MAVFPLTEGTRLMESAHVAGGHRYEVRRVIGQGGFGITYLAADLSFRGHCVVKEFAQSDLCARGAGSSVMTPVTGHEEVYQRWIERFTLEAQLIYRIRHPNVVVVQDVWVEGGTAYYAMEYVPDAREMQRQPRSWPLARPLLVQLLAALTAVHDAGLIHGDVKPENVLVDGQGRVVLIDFGTARHLSDLRRTVTATMFTRGYAPVELSSVVGLRRAGPWSDFYSWAMVAWDMLAPHPNEHGRPVEATVREAIVSNRGVDPYADAESVLRSRGVPDGWARAIARCLALNIDDRPRDGREVFEIAGESLPVLSDTGPITGPAIGLEPTRPVGEGLSTTERRRTGPGRRLLTGQQDVTKLEGDLTAKPTPPVDDHAVSDDPVPAGTRSMGAITAGVAVLVAIVAAVLWWAFKPDPVPDDPDVTQPTLTGRAVPPDISCADDSTCEGGVCRNGHCTEAGWTFAPAGTTSVATFEGSGATLLELRAPRGLHVMQTEVTQAMWRDVMDTEPSRFSHCGEQCPVERVTWFEALAFANEMSRAAGLEPCYELVACSGGLGTGEVADLGNRWENPPDLGVGDYVCSNVRPATDSGDVTACEGYRLPTRDEWIHVMSAGSNLAPWNGQRSRSEELSRVARTADNSYVDYPDARACGDDGPGGPRLCGTHPVGSLEANPWGVYDGLGNVREWTWSAAPNDGATQLAVGAPVVQQPRVTMGGSWLDAAGSVHIERATWDSPNVRAGWLGFRLVRSER